MIFKVWQPDGGESIDDATDVEADSAECAVRALGEKRYWAGDYPEYQYFAVHGDDGTSAIFEVSARQSVDFYLEVCRHKSVAQSGACLRCGSHPEDR